MCGGRSDGTLLVRELEGGDWKSETLVDLREHNMYEDVTKDVFGKRIRRCENKQVVR